MAETFNADEVFEMAEKIERDGMHFYKAAAKNAETTQTKKLLNDLANMEANHLALFKDMRRRLAAEEHKMLFDPDDIVSRYLESIATGKVFDTRHDHDNPLMGLTSLKEILKVAIAAENSAIAFYFGIFKGMKAKEDKAAVEEIINEEMDHSARLNEYMIDLM